MMIVKVLIIIISSKEKVWLGVKVVVCIVLKRIIHIRDTLVGMIT